MSQTVSDRFKTKPLRPGQCAAMETLIAIMLAVFVAGFIAGGAVAVFCVRFFARQTMSIGQLKQDDTLTNLNPEQLKPFVYVTRCGSHFHLAAECPSISNREHSKIQMCLHCKKAHSVQWPNLKKE